jgi:signal transduction histidine kinase/ActR/RegA family two-component response regulator
MNSLFGHVILNKDTLIANDPKSHPSSCGIPDGHPPLNHFLGIPFFEQGEKKMNGMVGIANKPGGYTQEDVDFLEPFVVTCSNLIQAYAAVQENKRLINTLEENVEQRTNELQLANQRLAEANRAIVQASAAQLEHFACMSHEIRTPLNCIIGMSSILIETNLTQMQEEALRMMITSGELLLTVVNDVLDYSKLVSGKVDINISKTNLQETLDSVVHSIALKAKERNVSVKAIYDVSVPEIFETDGRRFQQILYNILGNAIKFSEEDGIVELKVKLIAPPDTHHHLTMENETTVSTPVTSDKNPKESYCPHSDASKSKCPFLPMVSEKSDTVKCGKITRKVETLANTILQFQVKDYGTGISPKNFENIFQPFLQANAGETERVYGGTGLGLAITAKLTNQLGGSISVDSVLGEWSEFTMSFPYQRCGDDDDMQIKETAKKLNSCHIVLVSNHSHEIFPAGVLNQFNLVVKCITNCEDILTSEIIGEANRDMEKSVLCLIDEDLFIPDVYRKFTASVPRSILLTFGPNYSVKEARGHFRSLQQTLPIVFMKSLASYAGVGQNPEPMVEENDISETAITPIRRMTHDEIRILVAEDNIINQKVLVRMLNRMGLQHVTVVGNGQDAVEEDRRNMYHLVLMDMQMPIMGGLEACRLIVKRKREEESDIPKVIFVTANVANSFEVQTRDAGGDGFLSKPYNLSKLEGFLQSFLE